uniref:protein-glutamine glutaminase family protein n=1 Tax=Candidatus Avelusimicrobium fimicolum TaxID=3416216 RepID=UPI003D11BA20
NVDDLKNDYVETAFLNTLKNSAGKNGRAGFVLARAKWTASVPGTEKNFLKKYMQASLQELSRQVVLYEENAPSLDVLDKTAGRYNSSSKQYLYRPATDECAACTYDSCRKICRAVVGRKNTRSTSTLRLYEITMRSQKGEYLVSADGKNNFVSPDGQKYPKWQYHAAALAVIRRGGQFVPVVIDKFLFTEPVEFSAWLKKFDSKTTVMYLKPFRLREADEKRLVRPDSRKGKNIVKNGRTYTPYPIGN